MEINARGVAVFATLPMALLTKDGKCRFNKANGSAIRILSKIGFFITLIKVSFIFGFLPPLSPFNVRMMTAKILYKGTQPIIIKGAMPTLSYILLMKASPKMAALLR